MSDTAGRCMRVHEGHCCRHLNFVSGSQTTKYQRAVNTRPESQEVGVKSEFSFVYNQCRRHECSGLTESLLRYEENF